MKKETRTPEETQALAKILHEGYPQHRVWLLYGDLGSGKTTFTKGLAQTLGINPQAVKSPTFTFVSEYEPLIHYDLYRLEKLDELTLPLLFEHLETEKKILIEWPEKIEENVIIPHLKIRFTHAGGDKREIEVEAF